MVAYGVGSDVGLVVEPAVGLAVLLALDPSARLFLGLHYPRVAMVPMSDFFVLTVEWVGFCRSRHVSSAVGYRAGLPVP